MRPGGVFVKTYLISSRQLVATGPTLVAILRFAIGISAAYRGPLVTVVLSGEAVRCALRQSQQSMTSVYLRSAKAREIKIWAESESLEALGIEHGDLVEQVVVVRSEEIAEEWTVSDGQLSF